MSDQEWAEEQFKKIEPTKEAARAFDASEDGKRYLAIAGMDMWTNLGGDTLPNEDVNELTGKQPSPESKATEIVRPERS